MDIAVATVDDHATVQTSGFLSSQGGAGRLCFPRRDEYGVGRHQLDQQPRGRKCRRRPGTRHLASKTLFDGVGGSINLTLSSRTEKAWWFPSERPSESIATEPSSAPTTTPLCTRTLVTDLMATPFRTSQIWTCNLKRIDLCSVVIGWFWMAPATSTDSRIGKAMSTRSSTSRVRGRIPTAALAFLRLQNQSCKGHSRFLGQRF